MTLATQAEYARRLNVSNAAVSQWKAKGKLVMDGTKIDVEKTDEMLKKYRVSGLPEIIEPLKSVKHSSESVKRTRERDDAPVLLTCAEVMRRLAALDYTQSFVWSEEAQAQRAQLGAHCIGWEAVFSDKRDDGHWGGFQLRIGGRSVTAGYGFELSVSDVLSECRDEIAPLDQDDTIAVRLDFLHLLARPFYENDMPK